MELCYGIKLQYDVLRSEAYRLELLKTKHQQLAIMCLKPNENIPAEVHDVDQFIYIVFGSGLAIINDNHMLFSSGDALIIPAHTKHEIINNSQDKVKLFTIYSPHETE